MVPILGHGADWLDEPRLASVAPSASAAQEFGRALAHTHAAGASHLGAPPPGDFGQGWMGMAELSLPANPAQSSTSWGEFYAHHRVAPYVGASAFSSWERRELVALCDRLVTGALDHDQPALVAQAGHGAARTHGDLWSGNVIWTTTGATLIDPAAQGGHAEEDLAALAVFGAPFLADIWESYDEASPLADGWRERIELHQLHILVVHCHLFGRSYVPQTMRIVRHFS